MAQERSTERCYHMGLERVLGLEPLLECVWGVHPSELSWPKVVADDGGRVAFKLRTIASCSVCKKLVLFLDML